MGLLFFSQSIENDTAFFDSFETSHLKVLKKRFGDFVDFTDGKGNIYHAKLSSVEKNSAKALILSKEIDLSKENKVFLEVIIASSKWEREKMLIEKAVEIGVNKILFFTAEHSKRAEENKGKVPLSVRQALKQCGGTVFPELFFYSSPWDFSSEIFESRKVILLEPNSEKPLKNIIRNLPGYSILVGPEGGFTQEEKEFFLYLGAEAFNLGKRILRLETAAAVSLFFLQEINRD